MMAILIAIGLVLLVAILLVMFRIGTLLSMVGRRSDNRALIGAVNGYMLIAFLAIGLIWGGWYSYTHFHEYTLHVASEHGVLTDRLFWITMAVILSAAVPMLTLIFWFALRYRYREGRRALYYPHNNRLEVVWTIIPAVVLAALIFKGLTVWGDVTAPPSKNAELIEVVGQQFAWTARYPGLKDNRLGAVNYKLIDPANEFGLNLEDKSAYDDFKALELHVPKGKEVILHIRAKDVIHSVFLPHFRVKMDAVPGMVTSFKFVPTKSTEEMRLETKNPNFNYEMACAEVCGKGHFSMRMLVIVDEPADYEKWKREQAPWLQQNQDYLSRVPDNLKDLAMYNAGIEPPTTVALSTPTALNK